MFGCDWICILMLCSNSLIKIAHLIMMKMKYLSERVNTIKTLNMNPVPSFSTWHNPILQMQFCHKCSEVPYIILVALQLSKYISDCNTCSPVVSVLISPVCPYPFNSLLTMENWHSPDEAWTVSVHSLRVIGQRLINPPSHLLVICCKVNYTSAYWFLSLCQACLESKPIALFPKRFHCEAQYEQRGG